MRNKFLFIFCLLVSLVLVGCGDDVTKDPDKLLQTVKNSALGGAYSSYSYFNNASWKSIKNKDDSYLVQFEAEYDMPKIIGTSCKKEEFEKWSPEEQKAINGMMHVAVFDMENDEVIPRFSGWGLNCANGETKSFNDAKMNTLKEIKQNGWFSDCETMQQLAKICMQAPAPKTSEEPKQ